MSRETCGKLLVEVKLRAATPISVGGAGAGADVDLPIAVDGRGRPYVPGSSLGGVVRAWIERRLEHGARLAMALCGYQEGNAGHASWMFVGDAVVEIPVGLSEEVRHGIQIERGSGTAREKFLYTRAVLPRGSRLDLRLEIDLPRGEVDGFGARDFEMAVRLLLQGLGREGLEVGAARSRGLARLQCADGPSTSVRRHSWEKGATGLFDWLGERDRVETPLDELGVGSPIELRDLDAATFVLTWEPVSPVMSKSGFDGQDSDGLPLVGGIEQGKVAPVLPGASIRGVLRSHAARILRTRLGKGAGASDPDRPVADDDLEMVVDLFGSAEAAGRVRVADVYQVGNTIDLQKWREEGAEELRRTTVHEDHVAIDRFLGRQAEGKLYSARTPRRGRGAESPHSWEPIRVELDLDRLVPVRDPVRPETPPIWRSASEETRCIETALLLLVLRDLAAGLLPLGFGAQRGMGDVRVSRVEVMGRLFGMELDAASAASLLGAVPEAVLKKAGDAWERAWKMAGTDGFRVHPEKGGGGPNAPSVEVAP